MLLRAIAVCAALGSFASAAYADNIPAGAYLCTTEQKAGIAQENLEGADPPTAFTDIHPRKFRIVISPPKKSQYRVQETAYSGPDRDKTRWQTSNSVLHGAYLGNGWKFTSSDNQAFLRLDIANPESGWLWFYHAGFERTDAYHLNLSVRIGTCAPETRKNQ